MPFEIFLVDPGTPVAFRVCRLRRVLVHALLNATIQGPPKPTSKCRVGKYLEFDEHRFIALSRSESISSLPCFLPTHSHSHRSPSSFCWSRDCLRPHISESSRDSQLQQTRVTNLLANLHGYAFRSPNAFDPAALLMCHNHLPPGSSRRKRTHCHQLRPAELCAASQPVSQQDSRFRSATC